MMGVIVASAGPYADHLHFAPRPDREPRWYLNTRIFNGRMLLQPTVSKHWRKKTLYRRKCFQKKSKSKCHTEYI